MYDLVDMPCFLTKNQNAMATCLEMMFTYESSSMLHASVSGAVLNILGLSPPPATPLGADEATASATLEQALEAARALEASGRREPFQRHLFEDCRLAERILEAVALNEDAEKGSTGVSPSLISPMALSATSPPPPVEPGEAAAATGEATAEAPDVGAVTGTTGGGATGVAEPSSGPGEGKGDMGEVGEGGAPAAPGLSGSEAGAAVSGASGSEGGQEGGDTEGAGEAGRREEKLRPRRGRRLGHMGHVLLLSRAVVDAQNKEPREGLGEEKGVGAGEVGDGGCGGEGGGGEASKIGEAEGQEDDGVEGGGGGEVAVGGQGGGEAAGKSFVARVLARRECSEQWQVRLFVFCCVWFCFVLVWFVFFLFLLMRFLCCFC